MKITSIEINNHLALLQDTPHRLHTSTRGVKDALLHQSPAPKQWSPLEILAHLRSCADVWGYSIYAMLAADHPTLPDIHPRQWVNVTSYPSLDFSPSLQAFTSQRAELLLTLRALPEAAWSRSCDIGGRRHTIFSQARRMAKHEVEHCEQIEALLR